MIIVTQDKQTAFNFDHVYDVFIKGDGIFATVGYEGGRPMTSLMANYNNPARLFEEFDRLLRTIPNGDSVYFLPEDE